MPDEPTVPDEPEEPTEPETPVEPGEPTPGPETPAEPEIPAVPEKPAEKPADNNNKLPQTGANDATAIAGLGLLTAMMSLLGLGKRKRQ